MKKIIKALFVTIICLFFACINTKAADVTGYIPHKMIVKFEESFSTSNPPKKFCVIVNDDYDIKDCKPVKKGTKIYVEVIKVSKEKVGKLNASAQCRITKVYVPSKNITVEVNNPNAVVKFSPYEKLDKAGMAVDAGISVANKFVSNITYPAHFAKGMVQNKTGNRLKSGAKEVYDSSVLSYASKGKPLELKSGDLATLTFYTKDANANMTGVTIKSGNTETGSSFDNAANISEIEKEE